MSAPEKAPEAPAKAEPVKAEPVKTEPAEAPAPVKTEAPAKAEAPKAEAPAKAEPKAPAKPAKASGKTAEPPKDRKALDALVKNDGIDAAMAALSKVKVVDLRALAREYNGEFGIAGREIRNANKKALIEEFRRFFEK